MPRAPTFGNHSESAFGASKGYAARFLARYIRARGHFGDIPPLRNASRTQIAGNTVAGLLMSEPSKATSGLGRETSAKGPHCAQQAFHLLPSMNVAGLDPAFRLVLGNVEQR